MAINILRIILTYYIQYIHTLLRVARINYIDIAISLLPYNATGPLHSAPRICTNPIKNSLKK